MFHGVGTNGRQISMIAGGPQSKNGFETIMIDMPTYGVTEVKTVTPSPMLTGCKLVLTM